MLRLHRSLPVLGANPRILFVTATRIGDAVLSTGLLAHLIERYPGARVTVTASPVSAPLFQGVPGLERLIALSKRRHARHWLARLRLLPRCGSHLPPGPAASP